MTNLWHCTLCDKTIKSCSKYGHLKSKKHQHLQTLQNLQNERLNQSNQVVQVNQWHCDICDKTILKSSKAGHLQSKTHLKKVELKQTHFHCEICNISVKRTNKNRHIQSKKHKRLERLSVEFAHSIQRTKECTICYKDQFESEFKKCIRCVNDWCLTCNGEMSRCPYCRKNFPRNTVQSAIFSYY
jgi:hypothetical protein